MMHRTSCSSTVASALLAASVGARLANEKVDATALWNFGKKQLPSLAALRMHRGARCWAQTLYCRLAATRAAMTCDAAHARQKDC